MISSPRTSTVIALCAATVLGLAGCEDGTASSQAQYHGVCVDVYTKVYLDSSQCASDGSDSSSSVWDYILLTTYMNNLNSNPGYYSSGHTVTHVVYHLPANSTSTVEYSGSRGGSSYVRSVRSGAAGRVTRIQPAARVKPAKVPAYGTAPRPGKVPAYGTPPKTSYKSGRCC